MDLFDIGRVNSMKNDSSLKSFNYTGVFPWKKTQSALWTGYRQPRHGTDAIEYFWERLGSNMGLFAASSGTISQITKTG